MSLIFELFSPPSALEGVSPPLAISHELSGGFINRIGQWLNETLNPAEEARRDNAKNEILAENYGLAAEAKRYSQAYAAEWLAMMEAKQQRIQALKQELAALRKQPPPPAPAPKKYKPYLLFDEVLKANEYIENQRGFRLMFQGDSNLVLYSPTGWGVWSSNTVNSGGAYAVFQGDGNLVIYAADGRGVWSTQSENKGGKRLELREDGTLHIITDTGQGIWSTK